MSCSCGQKDCVVERIGKDYASSKWLCHICGEWKEEEDFYSDSFGINPFGDDHRCMLCTDKYNEEEDARWAYRHSPEGQAEYQREEDKREATRKKDLEDYYWAETYCPECGKATGRYIKNGNIVKDSWCGCYQETSLLEDIRH